MQGSDVSEVIDACLDFQGQLLKFLGSLQPENFELLQDLRTVREEIGFPETDIGRAEEGKIWGEGWGVVSSSFMRIANCPKL